MVKATLDFTDDLEPVRPSALTCLMSISDHIYYFQCQIIQCGLSPTAKATPTALVKNSNLHIGFLS